MASSVDQQMQELLRGTTHVSVESELRERLSRGKPLRVKAGFDPTRPDLHLGHTVLMNKMRQFQDYGHTIIFIVGDFTARIGDPTGRNKTRPVLTNEEIEAGARTYAEQAFKVLDREKTQIVRNSDWLGKLVLTDIIKLAGQYTLGRMMERDDFRERWRNEQSISLHEFLYPLVQAYDSVELKADVELGGQDQLFNLMVGRDIMRAYGLQPQIAMTVPLLVGTDGKEESGQIVGNKMSKSSDNYVGVAEPPNEQFGKLLSISDGLMWHYYELLSTRPLADIAAMKQACESGAMNPKHAKVQLAQEIVARYHDENAATEAAEAFERMFKQGEAPEDMPEFTIPAEGDGVLLFRAVHLAGLVDSATEAKRRIKAGAVSVNNDKITDLASVLTPGVYTIKAGKRAYAKVTVS